MSGAVIYRSRCWKGKVHCPTRVLPAREHGVPAVVVAGRPEPAASCESFAGA